MDLGTIHARLAHGYTQVEEFEADMEQMIENCLVFNDEAQYPHKVGLVVERHYKEYWSLLRPEAIAAGPGGSPGKGTESCMSLAQWEELREQASAEQAKPGLDCEHVSHAAPLNSELLYEWRVAQRFVLHAARKKPKF